jgi:type IV pilus assembly protein PilO
VTNLQEGSPSGSPRLRQGLLLGLPLALAVIVAGLVVLGGVIQPWDQWRRHQLQRDQLQAMEERLPLLRAQRLRQLDQLKTVDRQRSSSLRLIAGSGQISTFLAQLNRDATAAGVQLDLVEPLEASRAPAAAGAKPKEQEAAASAASDPLEADGLRRSTLLLSARGRYPNLLAFLRRLERLSLLVALSDLKLDLEAPRAQARHIPQVVLKLNLALYSEEPAARRGARQARQPRAAPASAPPS